MGVGNEVSGFLLARCRNGLGVGSCPRFGIAQKLLLAPFVFFLGLLDIFTERLCLRLSLFRILYLLVYAAAAASEHLIEKIQLPAEKEEYAEQYDKVNNFPYDIHLRTIPPFL